MSRENGGVRQLTSEARLLDPDLSPDGGTLVCVQDRPGQRDLVVVRLAGRRGRTFERPGHQRWRPALAGPPAIETLIAEAETQFNAPRWSPDGRSIAVERHRRGSLSEIVIVDLATKSVRVLASRPGARVVTPAWRPDGHAIVAAVGPQDQTFNLFEFSLDAGVDARQLTHTTGGATWPDVSPDGKTVVFVGYTLDGFDLFTMPYPGDRIWAGARKADREPSKTRPLHPARDRFRVGAASAPGNEKIFPARDAAADVMDPCDRGRQLAISPRRRHRRLRCARLPRVLGDGHLAGVRSVRRTSTIGRIPRLEPLLRLCPLASDILGRRVEVDLLLLGTADRSRNADLGHIARARVPGRSAPANPPRQGFAPGARLASHRRGRLHARHGKSLARPHGTPRRLGDDISAHLRLLNQPGGRCHGRRDRRARAAFFWRIGRRHRFHDRRARRTSQASRGTHVVAVRVAGGTSTGDATLGRTFHLGGAGPDRDVISFDRNAISLLRGFSSDTFAGSHVALLNLDYRWPIARPQRGVGTWPLFVHTFHAAVFADVGHTWTRTFRADAVKTSVGGELSANVVAGYVFPFIVTAGAAWGHDGSGIVRDGATAFVRLGYAF